MRQHSFRHRGSKSGSIVGGVLVVLAIVLGVFLVYHLIAWFRSSTAKAIADDVVAATVDSTVPEKPEPTVPLNSTALLHTTDGATAGTVVRSGTIENPSYSTVLNLPAILPETFYEVWLVKDGLADVKSVGALSPRADGSWAAVFSLKDPLDYPTLVIMLEANDGNAEPSGNRVAEGRFE